MAQCRAWPISATTPVHITRAGRDDAAPAARLIEHVFARDLAPDMTAVGRVAFRLYVTEKALAARLAAGCAAWGARPAAGDTAGALLGYLELCGRDGRADGLDHLSLLFVAGQYQRQGIGRRLLDAALRHLAEARPTVTALSVDAAPSAMPVYERLGFHADPAAHAFPGHAYRPRPMRLVLAAGHRTPGSGR